MKTLPRILFTVFFPLAATACIWDAQSLSREKSRSHDLAQVILEKQPAVPEDTKQLQARIKELEANRKETDPAWWNNLAGAYLRLNQPGKAATLLEPMVSKFPNDYGIHANLGTAYHLMGRYQDAEKEIARDLEINPEAHFGLEKYHLALLQYLVREPKYQARHVYVDEYTAAVLNTFYGGRLEPPDRTEVASKWEAQDYSNNLAQAEADYAALQPVDESQKARALATVAMVDAPPDYRSKWNLVNDTNFEAGVIYMAQMNPKEPACWAMLGVAAWQKRDYHLTVSAFERAISLGSPQADLLRSRVATLNDYISKSGHEVTATFTGMVLLWMIPIVILCYICLKIRERRRAKIMSPPKANQPV